MNKFYHRNKVLTKNNNNYAQIDASNYDYFADDREGVKKHVFLRSG